ncbi:MULTISPECIES: PLD nuclease N-terminal domain-containing protein [unclassified Microbacterium]|uniref:PLD nuclease N-terminal domain-containing protein n=1 Tax=unclassified Microbacterium TaxID=2609290 RepID=UPI00214CECC8|nr:MULTISPECIES: PLD nuclease N-terminal domain-containing protein [unclassified Microbacterium]MCR2784529.1 PLD nuclease N-terminal domain-containing protein [Microbacterium sp. zg.B96]WIM14660.1 PLD nuclease N-terminal domain-containing protein [Microbacterium sp. zg-B96]
MGQDFPHVVVVLIVVFLLAGAVALFVFAIVGITGSAMTQTAKAVWILITLFFPLLGPIVWFFFRDSIVGGQSNNRFGAP